MTTPSVTLPTPAVRMPRGTAVSAESRSVAARGTAPLGGGLASLTAFTLAALGAAVVTALVHLAL